MYSTCLFCHRPLGTNELVEHFPVGRRLAFDPSKGRLWVVCRKCERWNLSPLEERWEAFEECERLFRGARMRMSTDQIGLARFREGLVLVRIGEPLRPEFAAWRYGDQFGRRRKRAILMTAAGTAAGVAVLAGAAATGVGVGAFANLPHMLLNASVRAKVRTRDGRVLKVRFQDLQKSRILPAPDGNSWEIKVRHTRGAETFAGEEAQRVAGILLPKLNYMAGSKTVVQDAVGQIESAGAPEAYLGVVARRLRFQEQYRVNPRHRKRIGRLRYMERQERLALEMALHEEQERLALAGELVQLELAWHQAEEIAGIADDMFVPQAHRDFITRQREGEGDAPSAPGPHVDHRA